MAATLLSTMPLWRQFDPLPLLAARKKSRKKEEREKENLQSTESNNEAESAATRLFTAEKTTVA